MGPKEGGLHPFYPSLPSPLLTLAWNLLIGLVQSLPHSFQLALYFRLLIMPFCICGLSESWLITSALKMETAHFAKMLASTSQSTWHFNPKEHHQNHHCWENLKYRIAKICFLCGE
jgi:hypothetical protein